MRSYQRRRLDLNEYNYDAEVEYLESTGTQTIDTGYSLTSYNCKFEMKAQKMSDTTSIRFFMEYNSVYQNYRFGFYSNASNKWAMVYGNQWKAFGKSDNALHLFVMDNKILYIDNRKIGKVSDSVVMLSRKQTVRLTTEELKARVYYCKIYQNNTLVRDLIPVRKNGIGYMYDRVSKKLYGNSGTGKFIIGPDITSGGGVILPS